MTGNEGMDLDRAHALMMAVLDGENTDAERRELETLLAGHHELAAEWARLRRVREVTATMQLRQPPEEIWDRYRASVLHRTERSIAWLLVLSGGSVLGGWVLWNWLGSLMADTGIPFVIRIAIVALVIGLLILLLSVARERWSLHRRDPYSREVTR